MAAVQGQFNLPLLAFQHHVGQLFIDPADLQWGKGLGQSELAIVEQGRWRKSDGKLTSIVCKVWRPFVVATPQDFRELLLEASKLHRLQHPNIVRFLGLGCFAHGSLAEVRESMFMVEEYVGDRTVRKVISEQMRCRHKNLYDARSAVRWASQVASALAALHEQQPAYVHNDVKADNVFLTEQPSIFSPRDAKLGDLKPHRHVYDREPCTLSRHQQQQRSQSPKAAGQPASSLQQPRYSLERNSGCSSSGQAERRLSWSSATSSVELGPGEHISQPAFATAGVMGKGCDSSGRELLPPPPQQQQQREQRPQPAFLHAGPLPPGIGSSWSSGCSTATAFDAATAPGVQAANDAQQQQQQQQRQQQKVASSGAVTRVRSLPVPITGQGSSVHKGSSCPTNWNPGMSDGHSGHSGSPAAAAAESPGYFSASSHCTHSSTSSTSLNSSSLAMLQHEASSCPSSAPPNPCSLAAEIAAADAAAAAADGDAVALDADAAAGGQSVNTTTEAAGGDSAGVEVWRAVSRQRSAGALQCLSDSASSTGVTRGSGGKEGVGSLAADADDEDAALATAAAAADAAPVQDLDRLQQQQQGQQEQQCFRGRQHPRGRKGALAAAFASAEDAGHHCQQQQQQGPQQQQGLLQLQDQPEGPGVQLADSPPDVGTAAPSSPQHRLLSLLYKRSKSSPLDAEASSTAPQPHLQMVHSAPDVTASSDLEEAVHRGSMLMPLPLSEPTGLCSLQSSGSSGSSWGEGGKGGARGRPNPAVLSAGGDPVHVPEQLQLQSKQAAEMQLQHAHTHPCSSASSVGGGCVYYGWELLPSGAASPCGAVHSSMLDLFADMTNDDVITNRRYRDSCHYTLVPGSFVQQRLPLAVPITRSKSAGAAWDAYAPTGTISITSSGSSQAAASAGSKWTPTTLLQLQQQQQHGSELLERSTSIGKGCAPTAIESKQHGSNSAFAALTAIDCIAEEGSSMATDSCAPSRDISAHGSCHFYSTSRDVSQWGSQDALQASPQQQGVSHLSLPALVTSSSLSKVLGLSLLRQRSSASSITRDSSGGLRDNDRQYSANTKSSPPASPQGSLGSAHSSSPRSLQAGGDSSSPSKKQLLQLLAAASDGRQGSLLDADVSAKSQVVITADGADSFTSKHQGLADNAADAAAPAAAAVPCVKKVRFSLARPEGATASRDFSLLYAAPELVRGERPTEKVDVFAFGVLLYELLSRRLVASSVAAVCAQNSSSRRGGSRHSKHRQQHHSPVAQAPDGSGCSSSGSDGGALCEEQPEEQLLLQYAQLVAGGYRPPMLPHFPQPVVQLISCCWAAEPYERPRMAEVLTELQAWQRNRAVMSPLNSYVLALADIGYMGAQRKQPSCGCVIS